MLVNIEIPDCSDYTGSPAYFGTKRLGAEKCRCCFMKHFVALMVLLLDMDMIRVVGRDSDSCWILEHYLLFEVWVALFFPQQDLCQSRRRC